eukprot:102283-Pyramimonas_sp.AAC.1
MESPPIALALVSTITLYSEHASDSASCLANWFLHQASPTAYAGRPEQSRAEASPSDDASASVPDSQSDSAGCPAEPACAAARAGGLPTVNDIDPRSLATPWAGRHVGRIMRWPLLLLDRRSRRA